MNRIFSITSLAAVALTGTSSAIERLTPIKEPEVRSKEEAPKAKTKAWLGVVGQPVNDALAVQLGVPYGVTLEHVAPEGSAAKAGIKKFDVITRVGEKPIKAMGDLRAAMRDTQVNDTIEVEVVSAGNSSVRKVKLEARPSHLPEVAEAPEVPPMPQNFKHLPKSFQHLPSQDRQRIEHMMQAQIQQMQEHFAQMDEKMLDIQKLHNEAMQLDPQDMRMKGHSHFSGTFTMIDEEGSIRMTLNESSGKHVEVKDKQGNILYKGPFETEEEKNSVPDNVRSRIEALGLGQSNGSGLKFRFGR